MPFKPTAEQSAAIEAPVPLLVAAAAGSGKTAVLTERVFRLLSDENHPVSADRLLIVTFTNAAAAEMRQRISARLHEACRAEPENRLLARQRLLLGSASICTIDSFCIDLVREQFDRLSVAPDFRVIDPVELSPLCFAAAGDALEDYYEKQDPAFFALLEALGSDYGDENLIDAILKISDTVQKMAFPERFYRRATAQYENFTDLPSSDWFEPAFAVAQKTVDEARETLCAALDALDTLPKMLEKYGDNLRAGLGFLDALQTCIDARDWDGVFAAASDFGYPRLGRAKDEPDPRVHAARTARDDAKDKVSKLKRLFYADRATVEGHLRAVAPHLALLLRLTQAYEARLWEMLRERNVLSFSQTEHLALSLLCEPTDDGVRYLPLADSLCAAYDQVMVDEYQDVNEMQDLLFYALSDHGRRLFAVGDLKQSIYGFRGADPAQFRRKKDDFLPYDTAAADAEKKVILRGNFRSCPEICAAVNDFFGIFMSAEAGMSGYGDEEALDPLGVFPQETGIRGVQVDLLECGDETKGGIASEARHVAREIQALVEGGEGLRDKADPTRLRRVRYGDIAILLRSMQGKAGIYADELRRAGIPVSFEPEGYLETTELRVMTSLLSVIDNPTRDVPLLTVLASPIFGFTADELAEMRAASPRGALYNALAKAADRGDAHASACLDALRDFRKQAVLLPPSRLIDRLYALTDYPALVLATPDGARRRSNLLALCAHARTFEQGGGRGLGGFLRYLDKLAESGLKSASNGGEDAVRLLSIHRSKGLQFPICFYVSGSAAFNTDDQKKHLMLSEGEGIALRYFDAAARQRQETLPRALQSRSRGERMRAEELRLAYVAMTRAEERLHFVVSLKKIDEQLSKKADALLLTDTANGRLPASLVGSANSFSDWLVYYLLLHPDGAALRRQAGVSLVPVDARSRLTVRALSPRADDALEQPDEAQPANEPAQKTAEPDATLCDALHARFAYPYPYAALRHVEAKSAVSDLAERTERRLHEFTARPAFLSQSGMTPAERGTAMHACMQFADLAALRRDPEAELSRLVEWEFLREQDAACIDRAALDVFLHSPLFDRLSRAKSVRREMRFLTEIPAGRVDETLPEPLASEPVVVQGAVDCLFEEPDGGLVVLDFKTDRVANGAALALAYGEQLRIYGDAVRRMTGRPVRELLLYSFHLGEIIPVDPNPPEPA